MSTIVSGSDGIVFPDATTQPSAVGLSFRNKIINGKLDFWQRGTSVVVQNGVTNTSYRADRFGIWASGTTFKTTYSRQSFATGQTEVPGNPLYYLRSYCEDGGDATNGLHLLYQDIEDVSTLAGKTATLSFWAKANASKNISLQINQKFGSGGSPSSDVLTFIEKKAITSSWAKYTFTFNVPSIAGKTIGTDGASNSSLMIRIWMSAGSSFDSYSGTLGIQTGTFDFAMFQLEEGSYATAFEDRPYGLELSLCQRFYEKSFNVNTSPANGANSTTFFTNNNLTLSPSPHRGGLPDNNYLNYNFVRFKVSKRKVPTMYSYGNNSGWWFIVGSGFNSSCLAQNGNTEGFTVTNEYDAGHTRLAMGHWAAEAEF